MGREELLPLAPETTNQTNHHMKNTKPTYPLAWGIRGSGGIIREAFLAHGYTPVTVKHINGALTIDCPGSHVEVHTVGTVDGQHGQVLSLRPSADSLKASIELYLEDMGMPLITD